MYCIFFYDQVVLAIGYSSSSSISHSFPDFRYVLSVVFFSSDSNNLCTTISSFLLISNFFMYSLEKKKKKKNLLNGLRPLPKLRETRIENIKVDYIYISMSSMSILVYIILTILREIAKQTA